MPTEAIDPGNFIEPLLYATDPTIERLAALLQARPRGMMLIRDELAGLFANMGRYSGGSDRPFWLEAWNGGRHVVERVSGSIVVEHLLVGVIGSFQPDKLARAFAGDEDGMYGRFLYAWPSAPDYRPLTNEAAEVEPELQSALTALIRLPSEDVEGAFAPQTIWLSDGAIAEFEEFRKWVDKTKRGLDGHERQWLVKGETVVLRLAGTLAYMAWAISLGAPPTNGLDGITGALEPKTIDEQFMTAAIRLWRDFFWPHARAALRQIGSSDRHREARRALRWIKAHGKHEVSREDIRREALGQKLDAEQTQGLLDGLEKAGWAKKDTTKTGGRSQASVDRSIPDYSWISLRKQRELRKVDEGGHRRGFPHFAHFPHRRLLTLVDRNIFIQSALIDCVGNSSGVGGTIECQRRRCHASTATQFQAGFVAATASERACNSAVRFERTVSDFS